MGVANFLTSAPGTSHSKFLNGAIVNFTLTFIIHQSTFGMLLFYIDPSLMKPYNLKTHVSFATYLERYISFFCGLNYLSGAIACVRSIASRDGLRLCDK